VDIERLKERIRQRRAGKGVREAAREADVSPATLSRVENGKIPDIQTFEKICAWLGDAPATYLPSSGATTARAQVHFKKETAIKPETAKALSEMIMHAQKMLQDEDEAYG